jgi:hypothetical protein
LGNNDELDDLYPSPNNAPVIKSRRVRWAGRMGKRSIQGFGGKLRGIETTCKDLGIDEKIILKWIFKKWNVEAWTGAS